MGLSTIGKVVLGVAGANYSARKANKYASQAFDQRMQDAEKYGIHPLQALGGNANFQGTGGFNVGNAINSERALRRAEAREDNIRSSQYSHERIQQQNQLDNAKEIEHIQQAGEDRRLKARLDADAKSPMLGDNIYDLGRGMKGYMQPFLDDLGSVGMDAKEAIEEKWNALRNDIYDNHKYANSRNYIRRN